MNSMFESREILGVGLAISNVPRLFSPNHGHIARAVALSLESGLTAIGRPTVLGIGISSALLCMLCHPGPKSGHYREHNAE